MKRHPIISVVTPSSGVIPPVFFSLFVIFVCFCADFLRYFVLIASLFD